MNFKKINGEYRATRKDGQVIVVECTDNTNRSYKWRLTYEGDWNGDYTAYASTKKELIERENEIELYL